MVLPDKARAVKLIQEYILVHLEEDLTLDSIAKAAGYSKFYATRVI